VKYGSKLVWDTNL